MSESTPEVQVNADSATVNTQPESGGGDHKQETTTEAPAQESSDE